MTGSAGSERRTRGLVERLIIGGLRLCLPRWVRNMIYPLLPYRIRARLTPRVKPRILFVGDCYHSFWFLSRELRSRGWSADTLRTNRSPGAGIFLYDTDLLFQYRDWLDKLRHWLFFLRSIWRYDVFQFYGVWNIRILQDNFDWTFPGFLPELWDIKLLRLLGKRIAYVNIGCPDGSFQTSMARVGELSPCASCQWRSAPAVCSDAANERWGKVRNRLADIQIAQGALHRDFNLSLRTLEAPQAFCLPPDVWHPDVLVPTNYRLPFPEGTIKIYHAVGNFDLRSGRLGDQNIKSTHVYLPTVERLKREGHPVELIFFKDVPSKQVRYYQVQADIVVDMLTFGWYGANVREALMLGRPVVCYIRPEWLAEVDRQNPGFADELPIVSATPDTVYDVLKDLIEHPDKRAEIGRRSREFAVKWLSPQAAVERMMPVYLELLTHKRGAPT